MKPNKRQNITNKESGLARNGLKLGKLLERRREELQLSFDDIERDTHIRRKYLKLIEAGDYSGLSNDVYSRGYVKNYAEHLGFDTKEILRLYSQERHIYSQQTGESQGLPRALKPIDSATYTFSPRSILAILTSMFVVVMVGYVGWQLSQLSAPPIISLTNQEKSVVNTGYVIINGEVDDGSDVLINDSPILTTPDGSFSERVTLVEGSNQIKITAKNKFGKETIKIITVESNTATATQKSPIALRKELFEGVEVLVSISDQATYISVDTDGQNSFRGTMLPGSSQLFNAQQLIKLTTGNAGNTEVRYTNSVVSERNMGRLGQQNEVRQDIVFSKDMEVR